jgi:hypothetical protein
MVQTYSDSPATKRREKRLKQMRAQHAQWLAERGIVPPTEEERGSRRVARPNPPASAEAVARAARRRREYDRRFQERLAQAQQALGGGITP